MTALHKVTAADERRMSGWQWAAVLVGSVPGVIALAILTARYVPLDLENRVFLTGLLIPIAWLVWVMAAMLAKNALWSWVFPLTSVGLTSAAIVLQTVL